MSQLLAKNISNLKPKTTKYLMLWKESYLLAVKIQFLGLHLMGLLAVSVMNQDFEKLSAHEHIETNQWLIMRN